MRDSFPFDANVAALAGRHELIRGDGTTTSTDNTALVGQAVQAASLVKSYPLDVAGNGSVRVMLKPTTLTGTVTASLQPCLADGVTLDTTVTAVPITMALNTLNAGALTVTGHRKAMLTITTAAASTVQFGVAEYVAK